MNEGPEKNDAGGESPFSHRVGAQARRMLKARRGGRESVWFGLGMSGLIGWSVALPTLIGVAGGIWVDRCYPSPYSWTLMLLLLGLVVGCFNAWRWVESEYGEMKEEGNE